jgi:iron complex outermembrane receptor protein
MHIEQTKRHFGGCSLATLAALTALGVPSISIAQTGDADVAQGANVQPAGDIVVTAQRRSQRLQDVPLSITALNGQELDEKGAVTFQDYAGAVPSLAFQYVGPTGYRGERDYAIRGIYGSNTVGFYIDDTPVPIIDPELLDIARIEVLRGPQATLYGSNSMGGTIKFVTNQPKFNVLSGSAEARLSFTEGGGVDNRQALILNIPLVQDKLAARLSASRRDDSGFIDNYYDGYPGVNLVFTPANQASHGVDKNWDRVHADSVRAVIRYKPVNGLTITPSIAYSRIKLDNSPTFFGILPGTKVVRSLRQPETEKTFLAALNAQYESDKFQITNNFSYFTKRNTSVEDSTQLNLGYVPVTPYSLDTTRTYRNLYDELRFQTNFAGPFNVLVGALYGDLKNGNPQMIRDPGLSAANPTLPPIAGDLIYDGTASFRTVEKSVFIEARLKIFEHLEATAGLRRYDFKVRSSNLSTGFIGDGEQVDRTFKESGIRPRGTLSWTPSSHLTIFSNFGKGFRPGLPGGKRASVCGGGFAPDVTADTVTNYEIGVKSNSMGGRLQLSGTAYRMDWDHVQQTILLPCGFLETQNTGTARSQGVEFEANIRPINLLSIDASATYTDAKITDAPAGAAAAKGSPILFVPKWKLSLGMGLDVPMSTDWTGFARVDASYESRALIDYASGFTRQGYATIAARFGMKTGTLTLEVFAQNLTNERPLTNLYTFAVPTNANLNSTIRPRSFGVRASKNF